MEATSFSLTVDILRKELILDRYLNRFLSDRDTRLVMRSQVKPAYSVVKAKSCPCSEMLCQGIPRGSVIRKMVLRSKEYEYETTPSGDMVDDMGCRRKSKLSTHFAVSVMP